MLAARITEESRHRVCSHAWSRRSAACKDDSLNTGWRNASFRGYADYMQTPEFEKQIEELIQLTKEHRIALMCAEAVPWRCHRSLIGDALTVRGIRTEDIMSLKLRRLHTLTPFAHVRGSTVTYPAENSSRPKKRTSTRKKERTPRHNDRLQDIKGCENFVCRDQSTSRFVSTWRSFFKQQDVLVFAQSSRLTRMKQNRRICTK